MRRLALGVVAAALVTGGCTWTQPPPSLSTWATQTTTAPRKAAPALPPLPPDLNCRLVDRTPPQAYCDLVVGLEQGAGLGWRVVYGPVRIVTDGAHWLVPHRDPTDPDQTPRFDLYPPPVAAGAR